MFLLKVNNLLFEKVGLMKKVYYLFIAFFVSILYPCVVAGESAKQAETLPTEDHPVDNSGGNISNNNYQDQILADPKTNSAARVGIYGSGNIAIINQHGSNNNSSITQSGDKNYAEQAQTGANNEMYLMQNGANNRHVEKQIGSKNKKVIIQNDTETIIEQVSP
jgi:hypothetical protein